MAVDQLERRLSWFTRRCAWCGLVWSRDGWAKERRGSRNLQYETDTICPSCFEQLREAGQSG